MIYFKIEVSYGGFSYGLKGYKKSSNRQSEWHYTPEHSVERMMWEDYLITKCYSDKIPVVDSAVEVGFGCG